MTITDFECYLLYLVDARPDNSTPVYDAGIMGKDGPIAAAYPNVSPRSHISLISYIWGIVTHLQTIYA